MTTTHQPFADSALWQLQDDYFEQLGPEAWGRNQVPSYITSNPTIAADYARLVFAFFRDLFRQNRNQEPVRVIELGGGSGQFAFLFIKTLHDLCRNAPVGLPPFNYVFTDYSTANLQHVYQHPRMQPFLNHGTLSVAHLDARKPLEARFFPDGKPLLPELDKGPIIAIGNYFFDTIPQDLFRWKGYEIEGVEVAVVPNEEASNASNALSNVALDYQYKPQSLPRYQNRELDQLLENYSGKFKHTHLLFPHIGLQLLQTLKASTYRELIVLSSDKGEDNLHELDHRGAPELTVHGSFSLQVNFHALAEYCRGRKGTVLSPGKWQYQIQNHLLLFPSRSTPSHGFWELTREYEQEAGRFGPDNYFGVKKVLEKFGPNMSFRELVAAVRFSRYDPRLFQQLWPRWQDICTRIAETKPPHVVHEAALVVLPLVIKVWENFYPMPDPRPNPPAHQLAAQIGELLGIMGLTGEARKFGWENEVGDEEE